MSISASSTASDPRSLGVELQALYTAVVVMGFSLAALLLYVFGRTISNDAGQYELLWHALRDADFVEAWRAGRFEIGSVFVYWTLTQFLSPAATFFAVGLLAFSTKYYLLAKHLRYPLGALLLYTALFLHAHDANQVRAAIAACFVVYALITPHSRTGYLILAAVASLFHYSGVVIAVLYFVRRPLLGLAGIVLLSFLWTYLVTSVAVLSFALLFVSEHGEGAAHLTNPVFIMQAVIAVVSVARWKTLSEAPKRGAYFLLCGVVSYVAFALSGDAFLAHRLRELSMLGLFPLLLGARFRLTYPMAMTWLCVGSVVIYEMWFVVQELLTYV